MKPYKELLVWRKAMDLASLVYEVTHKFPKSEVYGLASQMQRSAISIPSNIAEGSKRNHKTELIQFLGIANGSAAELETQTLIAKKLYLDCQEDFDKILSLVEEVLKMLHALIASLK